MALAPGGPPHTPEAERSVLAQMMTGGSRVAGKVIGTLLEPGDFFSAPNRAIYEQLHANYYRDEPLDPLTIAEAATPRLKHLWGTEDSTQIVTRVKSYVDQLTPGDVVDHAKIVKHDSDMRRLQQVSIDLETQVLEGEKTPQEIGAEASHAAMQIATASLLTSDILSFEDLGRRYVRIAEDEMQARERGKELGAHFGMKFIDNWTRGVRASELWIIGGEPGAGKSAVAWNAGMRFAERQTKHPPGEQVGCFIASLEMGETDSEMRLAQSISKIDGAKLREARQTRDDMAAIIRAWGRRKNIPLYFNFASTLRASQLRALIVEAIRRHNCGLVIIDHFRYFDMDHKTRDPIAEDEEKARFLKEDIAKDLNVAVICLAHTTKSISQQSDHRPTLSNLRGSGLVAAHADFVSFVYRPYMYASEQAKNNGQVFDTDAEMIFRKNRHGVDGISPMFFEPHTMTVDDPR